MADLRTTVQFDSEILSFTEAYNMRERRKEESDAAYEYWSGLDPNYQTALLHIMEKAIEVLHSNVESWVPYSMLPYEDAEGAQFIKITCGFLASDIEAQMDVLVQSTTFQVEAARNKLLQSAHNLSDESMDDEEFFDNIKDGIDHERSFSSAEMKRVWASHWPSSPIGPQYPPDWPTDP